MGETVFGLYFLLLIAGLGAAVTGTVIFVRSKKTFLSGLLATIFITTILLDVGGFLCVAIWGVGMG